MKRRPFLKALLGTLSGAAALPFVKLPSNKIVLSDHHTSTPWTKADLDTIQVGDPLQTLRHTHAMGTLLPSGHTHGIGTLAEATHTHSFIVPDPNAPLNIDKNSWE